MSETGASGAGKPAGEGPETALRGGVYEGYVRVEEVPPLGLITLRAREGLAEALAALDLPLPGVRRIETRGTRAAGWMAPDEILVLLPPPEVPAALAGLRAALAEVPHLAEDISDGRAVLRLTGPRLRELLAKASPGDMAAFAPGELRRTHAGQAAVAFWLEAPQEARLICPRSVAGYVFDLFSALARPGSEVGLFA